MKKTIFIMAMLLAIFSASAVFGQTVNNLKLSEIKSPYIQFYAFEKSFSKKKFIHLEYGQKISDVSTDAYVKDENGKDLEFNSAIDFLNNMEKYGYELFQTFVLTMDRDSGMAKYVLKRK